MVHGETEIAFAALWISSANLSSMHTPPYWSSFKDQLCLTKLLGTSKTLSMAKPRGHVLRHYSGEREAADLIAWLNEFGDTRRGQPVVRLWEAYHQLDEFLRQHRELLAKVQARELDLRPEFYSGIDSQSARRSIRLMQQEGRKFVRNIERAVRQCHTRVTDLDFAREITRRTVPESFLAPHSSHDARRKTTRQAAFELAVLTYQPAFEKIRRCLKCLIFFYGRFTHKKFCSTKCQQAYYKQRPDWKAHRAEWMRRYRRLQQSAPVK
jgi:hypothetical protein